MNAKLTTIKYARKINPFKYKLKTQLLSNNISHHCLPNVEVWKDTDDGVKSVCKRLRWGVLAIESVSLPNTDIGILSYSPKLQEYKFNHVAVWAESLQQAEQIFNEVNENCTW